MKRLIKKLVGLAMVFGIAGTALFSGGGQASAAWKGYNTLDPNYFAQGTSYFKTSSTYSFTNYMSIKVPDQGVARQAIGQATTLKAVLWEYDPGSGNDRKIGTYTWYPLNTSTTVTKTMNINSYEDGDNGQAEIYIKWYATYDALEYITVDYFD